MKLCINCKYYHLPPHHQSPENGLCTALKGSTSLVTGVMLYPHQFASAHRINGCGEDAKFYVEKEGVSHE